MAITKENFIVVYKLGDYNSAEFAYYYASKHDMETESFDPSANTGSIGGIEWEVNGQMVGIRITNDSEILSSENDFNTQILNPLKDAIQNSGELSSRTIWGIVLGYKIPGGFYDGGDIISSTSRISRINHIFNKKQKNKIYNRSIFQRFNESDASHVLICSRLDAPGLQSVKSYIDNAHKVNTQFVANGTFYIDPYSDRAGSNADLYKELLLDFKNDLLPSLNLDIWSTSFMDPYIDSVIPFVENDSFVWSWFTNRATSSFFQYSNAIRVFFYNADYDGGYTIRDENGKRWPFLSMEAGYACSSGAMSNPGIDGFLNPFPFFDALLRGACVGEAYLFSLPYLDWTMTLFGDPLTFCSFPSAEPVDENLIDEHEVWNMMCKNLSRIVAHLYKREIEIQEIVYKIVNIDLEDPSSGSAEAAVQLLYPAYYWYINNNFLAWKSRIKLLVDCFFDFPRKRYYYFGSNTKEPDINDYLSDHNFKVSRLLSSITGQGIIENSNLIDEGWWQFEFIVEEKVDDFVFYHFILEVSDDEDFTNILVTRDSYQLRNWTYEKNKNNFVPMIYSGVSSSYVGRRVRYESRVDSLIGINEYLTRGETYYFRVTPYNLETSEIYSSTVYQDIIYS